MTKTLSKLETQENFLALIKDIYKNLELTSYLMM